MAELTHLCVYLGIPISQWGDPAWADLLITDDVWVKADPWSAFLPLFRDSDVVVVCSAGNTQDPEQASDGSNPRRNAKPGRAGETSLIVVGGTNPDGLIWRDDVGSGTNRFLSIITVFAPGSTMSVALRAAGLWMPRAPRCRLALCPAWSPPSWTARTWPAISAQVSLLAI